MLIWSWPGLSRRKARLGVSCSRQGWLPAVRLDEGDGSLVGRQGRLDAVHAVAPAHILWCRRAATQVDVGPFDGTGKSALALGLRMEANIAVYPILAADLREHALLVARSRVIGQRRDLAAGKRQRAERRAGGAVEQDDDLVSAVAVEADQFDDAEERVDRDGRPTFGRNANQDVILEGINVPCRREHR